MISTIKAKNVIHVKNTIPFEVSLEELYEHTYHFDSIDEVRDYVLMCAEEDNSNLEYKNDDGYETVVFKPGTIFRLHFRNTRSTMIRQGFFRFYVFNIEELLHGTFTRVFKAKEVADAFKTDRKLYELDNNYGKVY